MKKLLFLTTLLFILAGILPLMAQQNTAGGNSAETYALTVSLERVYPYRKGYIVKYKKGITQTADAYLPYEWFKKPSIQDPTPPKGEVILMGSGTDWPHMTIFYKNGAFDHVRLYVRKERGHESWGIVPLTVNIDDRFENIEDLKLEY
ncbi:hypothetical protein AGMMS49942_22000 [Spirochaetia bacterium]|nr:hypothetical protein AGMMS49942_22000 [Spirochaetia bacterium]